MRLYRSIAALEAAPRSRVITIGVFDGLHAGHEAILARTRAEADAAGESCLAFTFEPTPKEFFSPHNPPPRLTRFRERFERLAALGVDELLCPSFAAIRDIRAEEFVETLIVGKLDATHVVVGDDFRYGAGRGGTVADLRAAGERLRFSVTVVDPVYWQGRRVSSTAIREALQLGDLATARGMLGRDYAISGRVVRGLGLGRQLGFPTANVNLKRRLAPVDGIFAARVSGLGRKALAGVASVGTRPTIGGSTPLLEVLIFDFDRDIYGKYITVHFIERLRAEQHFANLPALQRQMHLDVEAAKAALRP